MSVLAITFTDIAATDFDDLPVTVRRYTATIDGVNTLVSCSCQPTDADPTVRQGLRDALTARGYVWTTEL